MSFLQPSGGAFYHLRAWRYGNTLWPVFHQQVRAWLAGWKTSRGHLVLVGPSGGYALEAAFLDRFAPISVVEPDGLARHILRKRFPLATFRFDARLDLASPEGFLRLADRYPDAAFLLCNLLGQQLEGQSTDFHRPSWLSSLEPAMRGRSWASWHDLASSHRPPENQEILRLEAAGPLDAVLGHFWRGGELAIHDHECAGLAPALPREYAIWALRPGQYHVVEWLAVP